MTDKEINECLATELFKLKPANGHSFVCVPNYIQDWQQVAEKLIENDYSITRLSKVVDKRLIVPNQFICEIDHCYLDYSHLHAYGDTIGKAVCQVAFKYIKVKGGAE